jgi:phage terminase large subunit
MSGAVDVDLFGDDDLHPKAYDFFTDPARFCLAIAGRRGAKTFTGAKKFIYKIFAEDWPRWKDKPYVPVIPGKGGRASRRVKPGSALWRQRRARLHYWVVADTYELLDEPKRYLLQFIPEALFDHVDTKGRWWLKGDILIEFKTIRDPSRKVGSGLNGMWIEEAARVKANAWGLYQRPALADKQGWCIFTTTPLGRDWTYTAIEEKANKGEPGYSAHAWVTLDNTRCDGLADEVEEARRNLPPEYFEREYEASRSAFIGQIYRGFKRANVVVDALPPGIQFAKVVGGCDWGFSNPGALVVCGVTHGDRPHLWFIDEVYSASLLVENFWAPEAKRLMAQWRFNEWTADPAEPDNLMRFQKAGIRVSKHRNYGSGEFDEHARSVLSGIRTMSALIHQGRVHVLKKCHNLATEFENYVWDTTAGGDQLERPKPHQKDHAVTVGRYIASSVERGPLLRAAA